PPPPARRARPDRPPSRAAASRRGARRAPAASSCRGRGSRSGRARRSTVGTVRVVVADPPAFTPQYDHELAAALARAGADVELATSRFRFGDLPPSEGYRRSERFYPLSSRIFRRSRLRLPLRAAEHLAVMRSLACTRADVL